MFCHCGHSIEQHRHNFWKECDAKSNDEMSVNGKCYCLCFEEDLSINEDN